MSECLCVGQVEYGPRGFVTSWIADGGMFHVEEAARGAEMGGEGVEWMWMAVREKMCEQRRGQGVERHVWGGINLCERSWVTWREIQGGGSAARRRRACTKVGIF